MEYLLNFLSYVMNHAILVGALVVKLPQMHVVMRNRSVVGMSEASLVLELGGFSATALYHMLSKHPFATWGENGVVAFQNLVLAFLFWRYTDQAIALRPRLFTLVACEAASVLLLASNPPECVVVAIGLTPTMLFVLARIPQLVLNCKQGHTGALAPATYLLQLLGNLARVTTTVHLLQADLVALLQHASAATLNVMILLQMVRYRRVTRIVLAKSGCRLPVKSTRRRHSLARAATPTARRAVGLARACEATPSFFVASRSPAGEDATPTARTGIPRTEQSPRSSGLASLSVGFASRRGPFHSIPAALDI
jgi:mannose-P-dolichol utilization defect protein 1